MDQNIVKAMADLEEEKLFSLVNDAISANTPTVEIIAALQEGLAIVGNLFSEGEYFISELLLAAEVFQKCQDLFGEEKAIEPIYGTFVLGTVEGDVHNIGKNIVHAVFESNGFSMLDLGVDVPPAKFIEAIKESDAKVIGLSCLLTTAFEAMKKTVDAIRESGLADGRLIIIGGGPVDESVLAYSGADAYAKDAQQGFFIARDFVTE
ncbi:MAG: cobalamin-dependent protein [Coriobacteriales bacterium]|jgi:methanogenic corrinoid protein MtbC1|nr:cobalamin-dependent protein [Coriobacteriales bacterium]